jgi:DNA polymerase III sliding clamp (beta) subunit (PCNA family)
MKLTIPRSEIKEAVTGLSRIVANKTTLPILSCVRFDVNGTITVTATDLEQTARFEFTGSTATGTGSVIIPFQTMKELGKGNDRELVEIEASPDTVTLVNNVGGLAVRRPVNGSGLDEWPVVPESPATKPAEGFLETFRKLVPFTSADQSRHMLQGICVDVTGKGARPVTMVATDGRRLTSCNSMTLPIETTTVIPANRFLAWPGLQGAMQEIGIETETTRQKEGRKTVEHVEVTGFGLKSGSWSYCCRTIAGQYPNWRQVIPDPEYCRDNRITLTDADVDVLRKVLPTFPGSDQASPSITMMAGLGGVLRIVGRSRDDRVDSLLDLEGGSRFDGKGRICLDRQYWLDALNAGFRAFAFNDECAPVRGEDGHGGTHVLMPIRIDPVRIDPVPNIDVPAATPDVAGVGVGEAWGPVTPAPVNPEPANESDNKGKADAEPSSETESNTRRTRMSEKNDNQTTEPSTLDRAIQAVETARAKLREGVTALVDVADALKAAAKEGKAQAGDLEKARATLQKLQAISL